MLVLFLPLIKTTIKQTYFFSFKTIVFRLNSFVVLKSNMIYEQSFKIVY